jgi:uncharacterized protein (DUF2345 family)
VFFDGLAAAREGDASACGGAMVGGLATTVKINGKSAVTVDSEGTHGNKVTAGSSTVIIGNSHSPAPFVPPLPVALSWPFTQHFVARNPRTGAPVANRAYTLRTASGKEFKGVTDAQGKTASIGSDLAESVTLTFEPQSTLVIA